MHRHLRLPRPQAALASSSVALALGLLAAAPATAAAPGAAESRAAFVRVAEVLRHPRCLNCHQPNIPLQGDEKRLHRPLVQRGPGNMGVGTMMCVACHNASGNNDTSRTPGAPAWAMAPLAQNWQGVSDARLCAQLKDRKRNGNKDAAALLHHVADDALVRWGWNPGEGRQPVSTPHERFVADFRTWTDGGMACPR